MSTLPITAAATTPLEHLLNPAPGRRQPMAGFDAEFVDIVDYIVRITDRIWHQKQVDDCLKYYAPGAVIHTLAGDVAGAAAVVAGTHATLASFPDRYLNPDNVIWSGNDRNGFYSSHRLTSLMTNLGPTEFGPATGKRLRVPAIADCVVHENRIVEEWLVRDNMGLALQLGLSRQDAVAVQLARTAAETAAMARRDAVMAAAIQDNIEVRAAPEPGAYPAAFAAALLAHCWRQRDGAAFSRFYDHRARITGPGGRSFYGRAEWAGGLDALLDGFQDVRLRMDHVAAIPYLDGGQDIAARWSLAGRHRDAGGAAIWMLGISHWRVIGGQVHDEWTLFDELALAAQIARAAAG